MLFMDLENVSDFFNALRLLQSSKIFIHTTVNSEIMGSALHVSIFPSPTTTLSYTFSTPSIKGNGASGHFPFFVIGAFEACPHVKVFLPVYFLFPQEVEPNTVLEGNEKDILYPHASAGV